MTNGLQHEMCPKCHFSIKGNCFGKCECSKHSREVQPPRVGSRGYMGTRGQFDAGDEDHNERKSSCKWCDAGNIPELSPHTKTYIQWIVYFKNLQPGAVCQP